MSHTLADAIRDQFNRTHPHGKNTLLCEQCRRTKDRGDFRETPWHGRAHACKSCEGMRWTDLVRLQQEWELEQARDVARGLRHGLTLIRLAQLRSYRQRYVLGMDQRRP